MTRAERVAYVRQAILNDVWAGENSTVEDATINRIVDKWEANLAETIKETVARLSTAVLEAVDRV